MTNTAANTTAIETVGTVETVEPSNNVKAFLKRNLPLVVSSNLPKDFEYSQQNVVLKSKPGLRFEGEEEPTTIKIVVWESSYTEGNDYVGLRFAIQGKTDNVSRRLTDWYGNHDKETFGYINVSGFVEVPFHLLTELERNAFIKFAGTNKRKVKTEVEIADEDGANKPLWWMEATGDELPRFQFGLIKGFLEAKGVHVLRINGCGWKGLRFHGNGIGSSSKATEYVEADTNSFDAVWAAIERQGLDKPTPLVRAAAPAAPAVPTVPAVSAPAPAAPKVPVVAKAAAAPAPAVRRADLPPAPSAQELLDTEF